MLITELGITEFVTESLPHWLTELIVWLLHTLAFHFQAQEFNCFGWGWC